MKTKIDGETKPLYVPKLELPYHEIIEKIRAQNDNCSISEAVRKALLKADGR